MFYFDLLLAIVLTISIVKSREIVTTPPLLLVMMVGGWVVMLGIDHMGLPITAVVGFCGLLANFFVGMYLNYRNVSI